MNEALEMLAALVKIHNEGEVINKLTWKEAERIVKKSDKKRSR